MTVRELSHWGAESLKATRDTIVTYIPSISYPLQKRVVDLILGTIFAIVFLVPMLMIALLVKLTSKGPVLYCQNRVGQGGKIFKIYKFRTMTCLETDEEFTPVVGKDPRISKFGLLLRKSSLDELPNLINVISGEMSLVGPRPHALKMDEEFCNLSHDYCQRYKVKPGVTGLAQIKGYRGSTDTLDKILGRIRYDLEYVQEASIKLDLKILCGTLTAVLLEAFGKSVKGYS